MESLREYTNNPSFKTYGTFATGYALVAIYHALIIPISRVLPLHLREELKCWFAYCFWNIMVAFTLQNQVRVEVYGDQISQDQGALVLSNHVSRLDYAVIAQLAEKTGNVQGKLNFFIWKRNMKVPDVKTMYNTLKTTQNWSLSGVALAKEFKPMLQSTSPYWTVVFPEVDVMTPTVYVKNVEFCKKAGGPVYQNLLAPRFSAFVQSMGPLRAPDGGVPWVYDLTITYWNDKMEYCSPDIDTLLSGGGGPYVAQVYVKKIPINQVPKKPHAMQKWLEKQWLQKDSFIRKRIKRGTRFVAKQDKQAVLE